jgi:hypothetical protein
MARANPSASSSLAAGDLIGDSPPSGCARDRTGTMTATLPVPECRSEGVRDAAL